MKTPSDEEILRGLVAIISDGFNKSVGALEAAGAIDTRKMRRHYRGVGSEYYDVVTEQIVLTAKHALPGVRALFAEADETPQAK